MFLPTGFDLRQTRLQTFCTTGRRSCEGRPGSFSFKCTRKSPGPFGGREETITDKTSLKFAFLAYAALWSPPGKA